MCVFDTVNVRFFPYFQNQMRYIPLFITLLLARPILAQTQLPIIKATSNTVSIRDGGFLDKNSWRLSPKIRPDIFTADRTRKTKWVTFYTDIDSIKVKVRPGTKYDFIVLLNGKDSCYTRIASAIPVENTPRDKTVTHDTIPFTLTAYNAIHVKTIINDTDTLNLHFDISAFGFDFTKDAIRLHNVGKVNKLQMGTMVWHNPSFSPAGMTAHDMDGRFGWDLFENRTVEIDYDHNLLIIHSRLPKTVKGYTRTKLKFIHSYVCAEAAFSIGSKRYTGDFMFDTGSDQAIILDSNWAVTNKFPTTNLKLLSSKVLHDGRGAKYETRLVLAPLLKISNFELANIPTLVLGSINPARWEINFMGNDLLKRFNMILDFKNDNLYLKPNKLMNLRYREDS